MNTSTLDYNTLYYEIICPRCQSMVRSGIGFRAGALKRASYRLGEQLDWAGAVCRPAQKPEDGNLKTIGYFNCDNPRCDTWQDCFPTIQEAMIIVKKNELFDVQVVEHKPEEQTFDIIEPVELEQASGSNQAPEESLSDNSKPQLNLDSPYAFKPDQDHQA